MILTLNLMQLIGFAVIFLLVQVALQAQAFTREKGAQWNVSPRDGANNAPEGRFSGRAQRALENYKETLPAFLALALALWYGQDVGQMGLMGALIWLGSRLIYYPLYLLGIPYLRSLAWLGSMAGLVLMLIQLL